MGLGSLWQTITPQGMGLKALGFKMGDGSINLPDVPRPEDAQFLGITDPQGQLQSQYSLRQQPRGEFEQRLRQQALQQGPTAATMQQVGQAGQLAQTGFRQNLSNMAQTGGVSAGARERLLKQSNLQSMLGKQRALAAGEQQKLGLQQGFAGQEAQERAGDVQSQLMNRQMQNQFNLDQYRAKLAEYAGAQTGRQQLELSKHTGGLLGAGGFLGSGIQV